MANRPQHPFDPSTSDLITAKARRLCRRRGFSVSDRPDVEQELRLHLIAQAAKFDPSVGPWETFASFILDKRCISLLRYQTATKRSPGRRECSLNDPVLDGDGRTVDRHQMTAEAASVPQRLRELERDVADVLDRLPEIHRVIALGLGTGTINSVARDLDIPRSAVYRHMAELREAFEDAGLRDYL